LLTILFESIGNTNTCFKKYCQYRYQYFLNNTFLSHTHTHNVSPVYFLLQQIKSKPSVFSLNHSGEITILPNETSVSSAAIHGLTERMNNIISKCSLLSLDRRGENTLPQRKQSLNYCTCWQSSVQFNVRFPDEWTTVQCRKICGLITQVRGQFSVNVTPSSRGSLLTSGCQHSNLEVLPMSRTSWS